jgi:hypothetical protein
VDQSEQHRREQQHGATAGELADHESENQRDLQKCIDLVFAEHAGKTVSELHALLGDAVVAAGHRRPPDTWLHAVSGEIADGRRYITGTQAGGSVSADAPT